MKESQVHLRQYCSTNECAVWKAISQANCCKEQDDKCEGEAEELSGDLRQFCAERCHAYRFNKWLYMVNKKITEVKSNERYT